MLEALDPASKTAAKSFVSSLELSDAARSRLESGQNVRRYIDKLVGEGLAADGLVVIARALPPQLAVAWGLECTRVGLEGSGTVIEAERAGIALAEQCLKDPSEDNRQLCLEFGDRARRPTSSGW